METTEFTMIHGELMSGKRIVQKKKVVTSTELHLRGVNMAFALLSLDIFWLSDATLNGSLMSIGFCRKLSTSHLHQLQRLIKYFHVL
jgi:hypothetical protein